MMKNIMLLIIGFVFILVFSGCTTSGYFKVPEKSKLYIYKRPIPVIIAADGHVETKPFSWTAAGIPPEGGIPYRLTSDSGKVISEGRLRAKFRPVSIFWPPFAFFYWPMGLNPDITYNLIKNTQF
ncbi:MAG: hypothetical protein GY756_26680 [bacterium]|nr:hypothetical protein [bacterium]